MTKEEKSTGEGIVSFVLSIIGLILFLMPYIAIVLSILSIVYAVKQRKIMPTGLSTAGLVIGIISTIIYGFILLFIIIVGIWAALISSTP